MSNQPRHFFEFGPFCLDPSAPSLLCHGRMVSLTPKALELLLVLVQQRGQLVKKGDLIEQVWPDTFVEEGNLSVHIYALRKALGKTSEGQNYIETVPKLGYRFVDDVREVNMNGADLVLERHTLSRITIAEHEATTSRDNGQAGPDLLPSPNALSLTETKQFAAVSSNASWWQRRTILLGFMLVFGLSGVVFYLLLRPAKAPTTSAEVKSMAVLPFKTLSAETEDEYLALGLADTLITQFGQTKRIIVRPTSAVLRYAKTEQDALAIGKILGVEAVLEGSIQRSGERLRVTVRLLRVGDGVSLWAAEVNEKSRNIFAVQDSISQQVFRTLKLGGEEQLPKRFTENTEAYQAYLKGRYFWNKRTEESLKRSIEYFQKAIELDPNYVLAHAGLADSYSLLVWNTGPLNPGLISKARIAARKALELDPTLAEAHASLAFISCWYEWDWQGAETEYKRAIELNPNYATAHHWYGEFLVLMGRFDEGFGQLKLAQQIDPLSLIISSDIGKMHFLARQSDHAIEQLQKTIEMEPAFPVSHLFLAMAYRQKGMYDEAFRELEEEGKVSGGRTIFPAVLAYCYAVSGRKAEARALLEQLKSRSATEFEIALILTGLGEKDRAFEWLEKAYYKRDPFLLYLKVDPNLDSLRSDPRFQDLLRRLSLV